MAEPRLPPLSHYAKATFTVVAVLVVLSAAWAVRSTLLLVLVAAVLAIGLDPPVRRLQRMHISRGWAVTLIFVATVAFFVLFGFLVIPPLIREVRQLATDIPGYIAKLRTSQGWVGDLENKYHLSAKLKEITDQLPTLASQSLGKVLGITASVASVIFNLLTIAILTIYFLMSFPQSERAIQATFRGEHRARNKMVFEESIQRIGGYVSGNIATSIIAGGAAYIFLRILGIPFAAALGMWVGIADLIPTVGATLGALAAVAVAFLGESVGDGIVTVVYFIVYQQVENYVIVPRVMKKAVDLSPAAVIVSVLIGGGLGGFAGALLALPLAAAAKVVFREMWLRPRLDVPDEAVEEVVEG
jgi:predicted PurR-regulated permease PerM